MSSFFGFVDSIDPDVQEILLDIDNSLPFEVVEGTQVSPAKMRYASASSMLRDGTITAGTAFDDLSIPLRLNLKEVPAEDQARAIQTLAQILNAPRGAWLKWQAKGQAKPVYFRTKRCSFDVLDDWLTENPRRQISIDIPAESHAYGEKVSGTFNIANDTFVHEWTEPIEGDVTTPLCLEFPQTVELKSHVIVASSIARSDFSQSVPFKKPLSGTGTAVPISGWTVTDTADTTTLSGTRRRLARAAAGTSSSQIATPALLSWPDLPAGEYRVLVRCRLVAGTNVSLVFAGGAVGVTGHTPPTLTFPIRNAPSSGAGWDWYDMGDVVSLPAGNPRPDDVFETTAPITNLTYWSLFATSASVTTLDLDSVLLLPVGGPGVVHARTSLSRAPSTVVAKSIVLDGVTDRRYFDQAGFLGNFDAIAGGLPELVPGANNTLHLMTSTSVNADTGGYTGYADFKTVTTDVNWSYFPRYRAGFRPAAS